MRQRSDPGSGFRHVSARAGAVLRRRLRISEPGPGRPGHLHGPRGTQVRPDGGALDGDVHEEPRTVVLAEQPVPHHFPEVTPCLRCQCLQPCARRPEVHRGRALDQHERRACREPVLTRVIGQRDMRSGMIRSSFLPKPSEVVNPITPASRCSMPHGAKAVTTAPPAGRVVSSRRSDVTLDHVVETIRPADRFAHHAPFAAAGSCG